MAEDLKLVSTITPEGYAAAINNTPNNGFRIEINRIQPVSNGKPKGFFDAKGRRVADNQVQIFSKITSSSEEYQFNEIWVYDGISNVVFAKIKRSDGGVIDYVSPTKDAYFSYDIVFDTLSSGSVTIIEDSEGVGLALAELEAHKKDTNAHNSIKIYLTIPIVKKGDTICVDGFGIMKWNEKWNIYRTINCGQKLNGWTKELPISQIDANGATLPKNEIYYGLFTAATDHGLIVTAEKWQVGGYHFVDIDENNFKIPDLRGYSDRNASLGSDIDKTREIFSAQDDAIRNIKGELTVATTGAANGVFNKRDILKKDSTNGGNLWAESRIYFDTADVVPTADDNHPYNTAFPARIQL